MSQQESTTVPPILNRFMSGLLRSPLHRLASRSVMLITFTGRKSGKSYTTPISYARDGDLVLAFTEAKWCRNLVGGAPVTLRIKNREVQAWADVVTDDKTAVAEGLRKFLRQVHFDARIYGVSYDDDGEPNWEQVQRAAQRTNMLRLKLATVDAALQPDPASQS